MKIAHISDLHFLSSHFVSEWGKRVIEFINSLEPEILVITGDITEEGYQEEYEEAVAYLDKLEVKNKVVVPGNHDARNEGYKIFEEVFLTRFPKYEDTEVVIYGIDSSEPDIDDGHIGRENYDNIRKNLSVKEKVKILTMHHHLIPIPGTGRERHIPVDAGEVLNLCKELEINFVLSGHKHKPWVWKFESTYLITAGTATTRRLKAKGYPSFNILEIKENKFVIKEMNIINGKIRDMLIIKR